MKQGMWVRAYSVFPEGSQDLSDSEVPSPLTFSPSLVEVGMHPSSLLCPHILNPHGWNWGRKQSWLSCIKPELKSLPQPRYVPESNLQDEHNK